MGLGKDERGAFVNPALPNFPRSINLSANIYFPQDKSLVENY